MLKAATILIPALVAGGALGADLAGKDSKWYLWLRIAALALLLLQGFISWDAARQAKRAQDNFKILVFDQLAPLARRLSVLAQSNAGTRRVKLGEVLQVGVACAVGLTSANRARATLFRVKLLDDGSSAFVPSQSSGRGDPPQSTFVKGAGSKEGDAVWEFAEADKPRFVRDVRKVPPPGWDPKKLREYRTFISVPVRAGDKLDGLLTVNAPRPGDLSEDDVRTMQLLAALIGVAIGMCPSN